MPKEKIKKNIYMLLTCLVFAGYLIFGVKLYEFDQSNKKLQNEISESNSKYNELQEKYDIISSEHYSLQKEYNENKTQLENIKNQQAEIDILNQSLSSLQNTHQKLQEDYNTLQIKCTQLENENNSLTSQLTTATSSKPKNNTEITNNDKDDNTSTGVYITETGKKYHRSGCRYLSRSKISISKSKAIAQGYDPCSVCNP